MKIRIAIIAACAVTFALAQSALAQVTSPRHTSQQHKLCCATSKPCLAPRPSCINPACLRPMCNSKLGIWQCVRC
jgi:hypothetical protein